MRKSTLWLGGGVLLMLLIVVGSALWSSCAQRLAVLELTQAGADVFFEDPDRPGTLQTSGDWYPLVGYTQTIRHLWLRNDETVDIFLRRRMSIGSEQSIGIGDQVTDAAALRLAQQLKNSTAPIPGFDSYALIEKQSTLDAILLTDPQAMLLGLPGLADCDLAVIARSKNLKALWLIENEDYVEHAGESNRSRYTKHGFSALAKTPLLEELYLDGLDITAAMAQQLTGASNLKICRLHKCRISEEALSILKAALPNTGIEIYSPVEDDGKAPTD